MRILVLTNNPEKNALCNYWIFKKTFILSREIYLKKVSVIFQLETALQQNSWYPHLMTKNIFQMVILVKYNQHKVIIKRKKKTEKKSYGHGFPYWGDRGVSPTAKHLIISPQLENFPTVDSSPINFYSPTTPFPPNPTEGKVPH